MARASSYEPWIEDTRVHHRREGDMLAVTGEVRHV
jgi:hypothetical protein